MITVEVFIALLCLIFVCIGIAYFAVKFTLLLIKRSRQRHIEREYRIERNHQQVIKNLLIYDFYAQK